MRSLPTVGLILGIIIGAGSAGLAGGVVGAIVGWIGGLALHMAAGGALMVRDVRRGTELSTPELQETYRLIRSVAGPERINMGLVFDGVGHTVGYDGSDDDDARTTIERLASDHLMTDSNAAILARYDGDTQVWRIFEAGWAAAPAIPWQAVSGPRLTFDVVKTVSHLDLQALASQALLWMRDTLNGPARNVGIWRHDDGYTLAMLRSAGPNSR